MITGSGCAAPDAHRIFNFTVNSARVPESSHSFNTLSPPRLEADSEDGLCRSISIRRRRQPGKCKTWQPAAAEREQLRRMASGPVLPAAPALANSDMPERLPITISKKSRKPLTLNLGANPLLRRRAGRAATTDALEQEHEGDASPLRPRLTPKAATCACKAPTINSL
eukprot:NODE_16028_length_1016_cov_4.538808.p2 GENE.NODE_16028_length_1016_cov_4.538808~~NODE_16028_length_1016_cov_4.538808.p2  ORF type:complete len:168 (-),score=17.42 NODE_16028_length_1016_cov_4.538808:379-882(-)